MSRKPRILFLTLTNEVGSDRIVAAMGRLGCQRAVLGPAKSFAARSYFSGKLFRLPRLASPRLLRWLLGVQLERIRRTWQPDLIIPLDDLSAEMLRDPQIYRKAGAPVRRLIEASFGMPGTYAVMVSREMLMATAHTLCLTVPRQVPVATLAEAKRIAASFGYPVVLKRDRTCGALGVAIVSDEAALMETFARLEGHSLILQSYAAGRSAFRLVACANGRVLDGISFTSECTDPPATGAGTVLHPIDRADMAAAAVTLIGALKCSGLVSLDFILSPEGACLVGLNPRPVVSGHLGRLYGHDVYEALLDNLRGRPAPLPRAMAEGPGTIALFPRELDRDPRSPLLVGADVMHDIPWDDLDVVEACADWLQKRHPSDVERMRRHLPLDGPVSRLDLGRLVESLDRYPS